MDQQTILKFEIQSKDMLKELHTLNTVDNSRCLEKFFKNKKGSYDEVKAYYCDLYDEAEMLLDEDVTCVKKLEAVISDFQMVCKQLETNKEIINKKIKIMKEVTNCIMQNIARNEKEETSRIIKDIDNFTGAHTSLLRSQTYNDINFPKTLKTVDFNLKVIELNTMIFEGWSGTHNKYKIIYDSDVDEHDHIVFNNKVSKKTNLFFLHFDVLHNIFGCFMANPLDDNPGFKEDQKHFLFTINYADGVNEFSKRRYNKQGYQGGICLCDDNDQYFYGIGNQQGNVMIDMDFGFVDNDISNVYDGFQFEDLFVSLDGIQVDSFAAKRIVVIQMK
ncbi:TLDc domain-containing protein [Entamoeba marina]